MMPSPRNIVSNFWLLCQILQTPISLQSCSVRTFYKQCRDTRSIAIKAGHRVRSEKDKENQNKACKDYRAHKQRKRFSKGMDQGITLFCA